MDRRRSIDFGAARVAAADGEMLTDRAQLLVTTMLATDTDRAVAAATDVIGSDGLAEVLPFLQPAAFDRETRKALRGQDMKLKELREDIAERASTEVPPLEPMRRVTWRIAAEARRDRIPGLHAHLSGRQHRHRHHRQGVPAGRLGVAAGRVDR